ncbi:hypothetical protein [uncultured Amnibacterium sp.]|uniref:hypothetical protein n=1 Tax=uncultured Amnibacterium sp. TaxID=1631851 RepID=UPI0035CBCA45
MTTTATRVVAAAALAAAAVGGLASCSSESAAGETVDSSALADASGTWTETGAYTTPGGQESIEVTLTVEKGTVTAVSVQGSGGSPNSQQYQVAFASGISAEVVGKPLATLDVGAVSGSSLTGQGFDAAVEKIRADAA